MAKIIQAEFRFDNGDEVTEVIAGYSGVITARCQYMTGCNQYCVSPLKLDKDGKIRDSHWYDEDRLKLKKGARIKLRAVNAGGPQDAPPRRSGPPTK